MTGIKSTTILGAIATSNPKQLFLLAVIQDAVSIVLGQRKLLPLIDNPDEAYLFLYSQKCGKWLDLLSIDPDSFLERLEDKLGVIKVTS